eukprot:scaffold310833_cov17-Tisochrysis_lutea.AAC.2
MSSPKAPEQGTNTPTEMCREDEDFLHNLKFPARLKDQTNKPIGSHGCPTPVAKETQRRSRTLQKAYVPTAFPQASTLNVDYDNVTESAESEQEFKNDVTRTVAENLRDVNEDLMTLENGELCYEC